MKDMSNNARKHVYTILGMQFIHKRVLQRKSILNTAW